VSEPAYATNGRSMIIASLQQLSRDGDIHAVVYYYWQQALQDVQTPVAFISSLLRQLLSELNTVPPKLEALYEESLCSHPEPKYFSPLADIFLDFCDTFPRNSVFIVIDAVDEVSKDTLQLVVQFFQKCSAKPSLKIVATARPRGDLEYIFTPGGQDSLRIDRASSDIKAYLEKQLKEKDFDPEQKAAIVERVSENSNGL